MSDRSKGGLLGVVVAGSVAVLCCAAPAFVLAIAGLGLGAWLSAHGLWLVGGLVLLIGAGAGLVAYRRIRGAQTGAMAEPGADGGGIRP